MIDYTPKFLERFWSKVNRTDNPDECWNWTAATNEKGYGLIAVDRRMIRAHRISYELNSGSDPGDLNVLHSCDNPGCVNPAHLFLGTQLDNMIDKTKKGRGNQPKGEQHGRSLFTAKQVEEIRELHRSGMSLRKIGAKVGAHFNTIRDIVTRRHYK